MCIIRKDQEEEGEGDGLRSVSSSNLESEFGMGPGLGANSIDFKKFPKNCTKMAHKEFFKRRRFMNCLLIPPEKKSPKFHKVY